MRGDLSTAVHELRSAAGLDKGTDSSAAFEIQEALVPVLRGKPPTRIALPGDLCIAGYLRATSSHTAHHSILQVTGVVAER